MLTQRQRQLLHFIHGYMAEHGISPSFDEMRDALQLKSKSGIHRLISGLEERGFIRRLAYRARAVEILRALPDFNADGAEVAAESTDATNVLRPAFGASKKPLPFTGVTGTTSIPILGRIAAGTPIEALEDKTRAVDVPQMMGGAGEHFVLEVVGDSMIDAGILDGDMVVVQRCDAAENGEIVVALIEEREVTLKRLRKKGASIALEAANTAYETRIFGPNQVKVQGRLVGLMRNY